MEKIKVFDFQGNKNKAPNKNLLIICGKNLKYQEIDKSKKLIFSISPNSYPQIPQVKY
jgi:hypothetical protein